MSLLLHAALLSIAVVVSARVIEKVEPKKVRLTFVNKQKAPEPAGSPAPAAEAPVPEHRPRVRVRQTVALEAPAPEPTATAAPALAAPSACTGPECEAEAHPVQQFVGGTGQGGSGGGGTGDGTGAPIYLPGDVSPPRELTGLRPEYTSEARRAGAEGMVIVRLTIGEDGRVKNVQVVRGLATMTDEVVRVVSAWRFAPLIYQGRAQSYYRTFPFRFQMEN